MKTKNIFFEIAFKYLKWFALAVLAKIILTQALVFGNTIIGNAADKVLQGNSINMSSYLWKLILLTLVGFIVAYIAKISSVYFAANVQGEVRKRTVDKLLNIEYKYFDDKGTGSIMNKLVVDINEVGYFFGETLPNFMESFIMIVVIGIYMAFLDWRLFLVVVISYPVILFAANNVSVKLMTLTKHKMSIADKRTAIAYDSLQGIAVGRSYNFNGILTNKINKAIDAVFQNEKKRTRISTMSMVLGRIISWVPTIVCYLFALYEVLNGIITIGSMFAFVVLLNRMSSNIMDIPFIFNSFRERSVSMNRINEIISVSDEESGNYKMDGEPLNKKVISFDNVIFSYGEEKIFNGLTFEIEINKTTAFVGGSGQGKTTAFKIMCGFYKINNGSYSLYGRKFEEWDIKSAREQFSLVSQNVFLLPETIAENVSYGKYSATMDEIIKACKNANIHDFIMSLPKGYDTYVGERGIRLSGGERQRISIARAFLKDAPILLLDEPTSAIDVTNEEAIKEAISRISKGRTVIIIAHRLNTIINADKIIVFSGGEVSEFGTHEELINNDSDYAALYGKQVDVDTEDGKAVIYEF